MSKSLFLLSILLSLTLLIYSVGFVSAYQKLCLSNGQSVPSSKNPRYTCLHDSCQICVDNNNYPVHPSKCNSIGGCKIFEDNSKITSNNSQNTTDTNGTSDSQSQTNSTTSDSQTGSGGSGGGSGGGGGGGGRSGGGSGDGGSGGIISPPKLNNQTITNETPLILKTKEEFDNKSSEDSNNETKSKNNEENYFVLTGKNLTFLLFILLVGILAFNYGFKKFRNKEMEK